MIHLFPAAAITVSPLPLPVHVIDKLVEGPWARFGAGFAAAAAFFGLIGVLIANATLKRIDDQIRIANREVTLVAEDLENNRKMISEALRRPDLRPVPAPSIGLDALTLLREHIGNTIGIELRVSVTNVGERISKSVAAEWLIPVVLLANVGDQPQRTLFGETYCIFEKPFQLNMVFWPNGVPELGGTLTAAFSAKVSDAHILLRFYDDAGTYPRGSWYRYKYRREMPTAERPHGWIEFSPSFSLLPWV